MVVVLPQKNWRFWEETWGVYVEQKGQLLLRPTGTAPRSESLWRCVRDVLRAALWLVSGFEGNLRYREDWED